MGIVRGIGYGVAILIIIWGIIVLPYGIVLIGCGGMMMWVVYKAGQKQSLKDFQKIEKESQKLELDHYHNCIALWYQILHCEVQLLCKNLNNLSRLI